MRLFQLLFDSLSRRAPERCGWALVGMLAHVQARAAPPEIGRRLDPAPPA